MHFCYQKFGCHLIDLVLHHPLRNSSGLILVIPWFGFEVPTLAEMTYHGRSG